MYPQIKQTRFASHPLHISVQVPWAHHGVASNRSSPWAAHFMVNSVNKDLPEGADGYSYRLQWSPDAINPPIDQVVTYSPPCYLEYLTEGENGTFTALWFYVVPLDDNNTRIISHSVSTRPLQVPSLVTGLLGECCSLLALLAVSHMHWSVMFVCQPECLQCSRC